MKKAYNWIMGLIGDPNFMRAFNGWATLFWIFMIIPSLAFNWVSSVIYVSALSLWALVASHWSAWQGARVEAKQQKQEDEEEAKLRELIEEIVERVNQVTPDK